VRKTIFLTVLAVLGLLSNPSAQADAFGSGANTFTIDFRNIGNAGNAADTTGYGAVVYNYRVGTYEISQDVITRATASGLSNVTSGPWAGSQPATSISWYEAAAFVNWLNTSTGRQAAYNLTFSGSWSMALWNGADAWTLGGTNLYRHKDAYYFLPSENEWYKAAYYDAGNSSYFLYPTASNTQPAAVASGTNAGTAVYSNVASAPAEVSSAGGLSSFGTMGQGGNAYEWIETAFDGTNSSGSESRVIRGGFWDGSEFNLTSSARGAGVPTDTYVGGSTGFRVASVPEPSTYALLIAAGVLAAWRTLRRS
jgi:hypothetical protein